MISVLLGAVDSDMYREKNNTAESQAFLTGMHTLKRVGKPEGIAQSVLYLASDDSFYVPSTASLVDGGLSVNRT